MPETRLLSDRQFRIALGLLISTLPIVSKVRAGYPSTKCRFYKIS